MRTQVVATSVIHPGVFSGNVGERLMDEEGDLFAPQLLGQLPDLHYIAKLSGGRIATAFTTCWALCICYL